MKYSNDLEQIRAGLINYLGAAQAAVPFEGRAKNQILVSILTDELLKIAQTEKDTPCDPYILVPFFKGINIFLKQQQYVLAKDISEENKARILKYEAIIEVFEELIKENTPETKDSST